MNSTYRDSREPIRGIDKEASGSYLEEMRAVGLKILKNKLSECVRCRLGETVLVTDRDIVVAELGPPRGGRATELPDVLLAEAVRKGWIAPPRLPPGDPPADGPWPLLPTCCGSLPRIGAGDLRRHLGGPWRDPRRGSLTAIRLLGSVARFQPPHRDAKIWVRIHARKVADSHGEHARWLLGRLALVELVSPVLARAREPFPAPVRTLDALHLATMEFLRGQGMTLELAAYDERMRSAARRMKIPVHRL